MQLPCIFGSRTFQGVGRAVSKSRHAEGLIGSYLEGEITFSDLMIG